MQSAATHPRESQRLSTLLNYKVLDTEDEKAFDELTELASNICGTPISLISLVDNHRQWFKSRVGLDATETPRSIAFCTHAILQDKVFEVPNALEDPRFADNPLVTGDPDIRFYAGAPLVAPDGNPIGTLCVIDREPKKLTESQTRALSILSAQVISQLELRRHNHHLEQINREQESLFASIAHDLRAPFNGILGLSKHLSQKAEALSPTRITHLAHGILGSSLQVYQLLDELLQWSAKRYGARRSELTPQQLLPLVEDSLEILLDTMVLKKIHFECTIPKSLYVNADATLSKTVIRNLLTNAIKFTPENGAIRVSAEENHDVIDIHIHNNGKSISEDIRKSLFINTVKSESGTAGEDGSGIGLRLCQEFVEMQGGKIWLDSSAEIGNDFIFSLTAQKNHSTL